MKSGCVRSRLRRFFLNGHIHSPLLSDFHVCARYSHQCNAIRSGIRTTYSASSCGRWIGPAAPDESGDKNIPSNEKTGGTGGDAADASLRRWVSGGPVPRRSDLVRWLLLRLELVRDSGVERARTSVETMRRADVMTGDNDGDQGWSLAIRSPVGGTESDDAAHASHLGHRRVVHDAMSRHHGAWDEEVDPSLDHRPPRAGRSSSDGGRGREWKMGDQEAWSESNSTTGIPSSKSNGESTITVPSLRENQGKPSRLRADGSGVGAGSLPPSYDDAVRLHSPGRREQEEVRRVCTRASSRGVSGAPEDKVPSLSSEESRESPPSYRSRDGGGVRSTADNKMVEVAAAQQQVILEDRRVTSDNRAGHVDHSDTPPPPYRLFTGDGTPAIPASTHEDGQDSAPTYLGGMYAQSDTHEDEDRDRARGGTREGLRSRSYSRHITAETAQALDRKPERSGRPRATAAGHAREEARRRETNEVPRRTDPRSGSASAPNPRNTPTSLQLHQRRVRSSLQPYVCGGSKTHSIELAPEDLEVAADSAMARACLRKEGLERGCVCECGSKRAYRSTEMAPF